MIMNNMYDHVCLYIYCDMKQDMIQDCMYTIVFKYDNFVGKIVKAQNHSRILSQFWNYSELS